MGDWSHDENERQKNLHDGKAHDAKASVYSQGEASASGPVEHFLERHPVGPSDPLDERLRQALLTGYNSGWANEQHMGNEPVKPKKAGE